MSGRRTYSGCNDALVVVEFGLRGVVRERDQDLLLRPYSTNTDCRKSEHGEQIGELHFLGCVG